MSEVRLVVREAGRDWSGTMHHGCVGRAIAALSADPVTLEELEIATVRFAKPIPERRFFVNLSPRLCDEACDAGLAVIDLFARLVVVDSTALSPGPEGAVWYHDGKSCTGEKLRYHLADDWLFLRESPHWQCVADERRRGRIAKPIRDVRAIIYGLPMLEFLAREAFTAFARQEKTAAFPRARRTADALECLTNEAHPSLPERDAEQFCDEANVPTSCHDQEQDNCSSYEAIKQIHAKWLLTPREDLGDRSPREIAFDRREHLTRDMQDRCDQWSLLGVCPPELDESSHAFQYGGFGSHELVMYYNLVRELLWSCWDRLSEQAQVMRHPQMLSIGDFLTTEIPRLEQVRKGWLDTPDPEFHSRTPRSIIGRERARLPEGLFGHEAIVDPDCPCCQMMAELPGPVFWHLDGCGMDDDFAFDIYHRTREEWEEEQREWEEQSRSFNAEWTERERIGVTEPMPGSNSSIWSRSASVGDSADLPLGVRVFGIGCHLAELIVDLRSRAECETAPVAEQSHIDQLNRNFGNLREILQSSEISLTHALIDPVLSRFAETLMTVAAERPDLGHQCENITDELQHLLEPSSPDSTRDWLDPDIPF